MFRNLLNKIIGDPNEKEIGQLRPTVKQINDLEPTYVWMTGEELRAQTDKPLVLGFGISQPEQARRMNALVDGFIVGSALVKAGQSGIHSVRDLATRLRAALDD